VKKRGAEKIEVRAIWVTRWDFRSAEDIAQIMENVLWMGCNVVYFQVRGEASCFFRSNVEPWAWELTPGGVDSLGQDPGWDPLSTALREAHARGLQLHAYLNVLPAWQQKVEPPKLAGHVLTEHSDWIMVDKKGRTMDPSKEGFYAFLNPAIPEARAHLANLFKHLARQYPTLDGVHLDYIRYPGEIGDYSYDKRTLDLFSSYTGGMTPESSPDYWNRWRAMNINLTLAEIGRAMRAENPRLELSAAVIADCETAIKLKHQYWLNWPALGLVDTLTPMAYFYDNKRYRMKLEQSLVSQRPHGGSVVVGLWPAEKWREKNGYTFDTLDEQVQIAREFEADGIALFAYSVFFPQHKPNDWARHVKSKLFPETTLLRKPVATAKRR
jgi:uncharacterized lipoprotein YddW (UPF0748 family)